MALAGNSSAELVRTKGALDDFLSDKSKLDETRKWLQSATPDEAKVLRVFERTFQCYIMEVCVVCMVEADRVCVGGRAC